MEIIFYFFLTPIIFIEIYNYRLHDLYNKVRVIKKDKEKLNLLLETNKQEMVSSCVFNLYYILMVILGLFTKQWIIFLILFGSSYIPTPKKWMRFISAVICIITILFIIINKFHLRLFFY